MNKEQIDEFLDNAALAFKLENKGWSNVFTRRNYFIRKHHSVTWFGIDIKNSNYVIKIDLFSDAEFANGVSALAHLHNILRQKYFLHYGYRTIGSYRHSIDIILKHNEFKDLFKLIVDEIDKTF